MTAIEIQTIQTDKMNWLIQAIRDIDLKPLAEVLMLWCFDLSWDDLPFEISESKLTTLKFLLDSACSSYSIKIGGIEYVKNAEYEDLNEELEDI